LWDAALKALDSRVINASEVVKQRFLLSQLQEGIELMHDNARPEKIKVMILFD
jgi:threonine dehydrogenase-like Zn-dependent dehydrogenase